MCDVNRAGLRGEMGNKCGVIDVNELIVAPLLLTLVTRATHRADR